LVVIIGCKRHARKAQGQTQEKSFSWPGHATVFT
jgi:hypothetical protein